MNWAQKNSAIKSRSVKHYEVKKSRVLGMIFHAVCVQFYHTERSHSMNHHLEKQPDVTLASGVTSQQKQDSAAQVEIFDQIFP